MQIDSKSAITKQRRMPWDDNDCFDVHILCIVTAIDCSQIDVAIWNLDTSSLLFKELVEMYETSFDDEKGVFARIQHKIHPLYAMARAIHLNPSSSTAPVLDEDDLATLHALALENQIISFTPIMNMMTFLQPPKRRVISIGVVVLP